MMHGDDEKIVYKEVRDEIQVDMDDSRRTEEIYVCEVYISGREI